MRHVLSLTMTGLALTVVPCSAQVVTPTGDSTAVAQAIDVQSIDAIIASLYDVISGPAGEARDWDRFRSLFVHDAKLIPAFTPGEGQANRAMLLTTEDYVSRSGPMVEERGFLESEIGRVTEQFENIAHVFSTYESRWTQDGDVFQRGINSIQLLFDGERWWIVNIMWWGVRPDTEIPKQYLGQEG